MSDGATVPDVVRWLLDQGVAIGVLIFFLLDLRTTLRTLTDQQRQLLDGIGKLAALLTQGKTSLP